MGMSVWLHGAPQSSHMIVLPEMFLVFQQLRQVGSFGHPLLTHSRAWRVGREFLCGVYLDQLDMQVLRLALGQLLDRIYAGYLQHIGVHAADAFYARQVGAI